MFSRQACVVASVGFVLAATAAAQSPTELLARTRPFPEVTAGVTSLRARGAGAERRYYLLARTTEAARPGFVVHVLDAAGKHVSCIPACSAPSAPSVPLLSGDDIDVDASGRIYVAERGVNAILAFSPEGTLARTLPIAAPTSVVALGAGEVAVSSMKTPKLVTVFNAEGKVAREFGDPMEVSTRGELNRYLHTGRLVADSADHIYYSFSYLPEPTVRKYDRFGYALAEVELATLEFQPAAQAARREIARQTSGGGTPSLKAVITALGVDAVTEGIWVAVGSVLLQFDREGVRRGTYRTFTAEGARLDGAAIVVEPDRLLIASDTLGVFEFPRPDKPLKPR